MNMYVEDDNMPGSDYCGAHVYVYDEKQDAYVCKSIERMGERNEHTVKGKIKEEIMEEFEMEQGLDAIPPMYPEE